MSGRSNKRLAEAGNPVADPPGGRSQNPIKVYIDSPGGDADAGYAIFDMMRFVKPQVTMIGMACGKRGRHHHAGGAQERRVAPPQLPLPIHQPMSGNGGGNGD